MSNKHPSAGKPVQITSGPLKDKYFVVIDFLVNQFQGKDIKKIAKAHPELTRDLEKRKALDDTAVFGRLYPTMEHICVPDAELKKPVSKSEKKRLEVLKGGKDDTTGSSEGDNQSTEPGESESDGRSVSGGEEYEEVESPYSEPAESDSSSGSGDSGPETESDVPDKPKAKGGRGTGKGKSKK